MSGNTFYDGAGPLKYEARKQLFSNVLELSYIKGPTRTFDVEHRLSAINDALVDTVVRSTAGRSPKSEYKLINSDCLSTLVDLHLIAEFYMELRNQRPTGRVSGGKVILNSFEALASYADNTNALAIYAPGDKKPTLVREDADGRKYIELTAAGEKAFKEIWNCGNNYVHTDIEIPFSQLKEMNKDLILESNQDLATVVNREENSTSILAQNEFSSLGPWSPDKVPNEAIVGSRKSVKGRYLSQKF